jgi:putative transposase
MKNSHSFTELYYHLVLVTKYRKPFNFTRTELDILETLCINEGLENIKINSGDDHIHLLFECKPSLCLSALINRLKSNSSRGYKYCTKTWPGWQNGYYCGSVGQNDLNKVRNYIDNQ